MFYRKLAFYIPHAIYSKPVCMSGLHGNWGRNTKPAHCPGEIPVTIPKRTRKDAVFRPLLTFRLEDQAGLSLIKL